MQQATAEANDTTAPPTFDCMPLSAEVRRSVDELGYTHPTPVQRAVFESAAKGRNLVVQARTGTGKTSAFGLPIVDKLVKRSVRKTQALILCPIRELSLQVTRELQKLGEHRGISVVPIYGGASMGQQIDALAHGPHVVVGTPGRVLDHIRRGTFDTSHIRIFVLDEADEMLSMGFAKELSAIAESLPKERQGLYFSATIPPEISRLAEAQLKDPEFVTLSSDQVGALEILHLVYIIRSGDKRSELLRIIEAENPQSAIVFCNTKDETERLATFLGDRGFDAAWLNGDLEQSERERVMARTREGKLRFLVATDVAARGIDISHLTHVINYDFPDGAEAYVHRTGRTGRAGRTGTAISLVGPRDIGGLYLLRLTYKIRPIERELPTPLELRTREEHDLVTFFLEAYAGKPTSEADVSLARRLLTHPHGERVIAGLLRDHLGTKQDAPTQAAEARRAKNPPPVPSAEVPPHPARPAPTVRAEQDTLTGAKSESPAVIAPSRPPRERRPPPRDNASRTIRADESTDKATPPREAASPVAKTAAEPGPAREASRTSRRPLPPRRPAPAAASSSDEEFAMPGFQVEGESAVSPSSGPPEALRTPRSEAMANKGGWNPPAEHDDDVPLIAPRRSPKPSLRAAQTPEPDETDFVELFFNVGKRDGVEEENLESLLVSLDGILADDVGRIRMRDRMSFVFIRRAVMNKVLADAPGKVLGRRTLAVQVANTGPRESRRPEGLPID